jgi:hypothetical protein
MGKRSISFHRFLEAVARAAHSDAVMFGLFFGVILAGLHPYINMPFHWDAVGYVSHHTYNILGHPFLPFVTGNEDTGHPTLIFWLAALLWRVFGVNLWAPRLLMFLFGAMLLLYTYKTGRRLGLGLAGAFIAPLTLSLTPLAASQTAQFQLDIPLTAPFVAAAYYQLKGNRPGRLALFGAAMVLCKLTGILLLIPLMLFALAVSVARNGLAAWKAHLRNQAPFFPPLAALSLFFLLRWISTGTVLAKFASANQTGISLDLKTLLTRTPYYVCAFVFFNDAYLLLPILVFALLLFWRPGRPAVPQPPAAIPKPAASQLYASQDPPRVSWWHFSFLALLVLVLFSIPNILRTAFMVVPRHFLPYLFFLHLATAWAFLRFWRMSKPAGVILLLLLCTVLLFHWHPKYGNRPSLRAFRPLLQNYWVVNGVKNGEETFEWVDYVYVTKRMAEYIARKYPDDRMILAVYPENAELMYPYAGYVSRPCRVHSAWTAGQFRRAVENNWISLCLFTSHTIIDYDMKAQCKQLSLRLIKCYKRQNAWCALYENPPPPQKSPPPAYAPIPSP